MTTITTEKIEELKQQITMYGCALVANRDDESERVFSKIEEELLDLAQRAMVPQPQEGKSFVEWALPESEYVPDFGLAVHEDEVKQYGQECYDAGRASQQPQGRALPELLQVQNGKMVDELREIGSSWMSETGRDVLDEFIERYASQLALPAGPVPEGELKEILGDLWDEGYVSPATYNDVDIRDPEERQRMRDHNVSEAQRRIAAALSAPASPAVAQPVADERAIRHAALEEAKEACLKGGLNFSANLITELQEAHSRAALCPPAKEGDKA